MKIASSSDDCTIADINEKKKRLSTNQVMKIMEGYSDKDIET